MIDERCDGKVDEIIDWDAATSTFKVYRKNVYNWKYFLEADEILAEKKKELGVEKYQKIWEQKRNEK